MKQFIIPVLIMVFAAGCGNGGQKNTTDVSRSFRQIIDMHAGSADIRDTVDFGRMERGEQVEYNLGIRNADTAVLVILNIVNGCGCTSLKYDKQPILPGDTASIQLLYDSKGQHGFQMKTMQIVTTLDDEPHTVHLIADVRN